MKQDRRETNPEVKEAWDRYMASSAQRDNDRDPVERMVRDCTAEEMTDWMIGAHGLDLESRQTVVSNLREQFKWHRLQGRLDRHPTLAIIAELLHLRSAESRLRTPKSK